MAGASLLCLLLGLFFLTLQIKAIFTDQIKLDYTELVLGALEQAQSARNLAGVLQQLDNGGDAQTNAYGRARKELANRVASLAAVVNASPSPAPRIPQSALSPDASLTDTDTLLSAVSAYWRALRNGSNADMHTRIARVANTLIVFSTLVFGVLITSLGMYARRARQLAGESRKFAHAALHDPMTGLPNRRELFAKLAEAVAKSSGGPTRQRVAVFYIDLDGFKQVNDLRGHHFGDRFLIAVSTRFRQSVRQADVIARIGGDEFAVVVRDASTDAELGAIAQRLIACVTQTAEQMEIGFVRASIGIASFPDRVGDHRRLVAAADEAMYRVKRGGKNAYAFARHTDR